MPQAPAVSGLPSGALVMWAASAAPTGYLLCDGAAVSRSTYAALFSAIGTAWGVGDGSTTFNLPDLRGRVAIGESPGLLSGGRNAEHNLAESGGAEVHALAIPELPPHAHTAPEPDAYIEVATAAGSVVVANIDPALGITGVTGTGTAHNNMQPFAVVNYIIKT